MGETVGGERRVGSERQPLGLAIIPQFGGYGGASKLS